jgi:hypothetical protein
VNREWWSLWLFSGCPGHCKQMNLKMRSTAHNSPSVAYCKNNCLLILLFQVETEIGFYTKMACISVVRW